MNLTENINKIFHMLELVISQEELTKFKNTDKNNLYLYHFGFGVWIRNNLLTEEGTLYKLFVESNIIHKDIMSSQIITLFHEYLPE